MMRYALRLSTKPIVMNSIHHKYFAGFGAGGLSDTPHLFTEDEIQKTLRDMRKCMLDPKLDEAWGMRLRGWTSKPITFEIIEMVETNAVELGTWNFDGVKVG